MKKYIPILKNTQLFSGITDEELSAMLQCLHAKLCTYNKGEYVFHQGEHIDYITILIKGKLLIKKDDFWGNRSIINAISVGEMFGESYLSPDSGTMLNDVIAEEPSEVVFFDIYRIITVCPSACRFHAQVVRNLFFALSEKNRKLVQKLGHMSKRSTRAKLISYLSEEAKKHNSSTFTIPFNRQQLADFLSVDRSSMSNELCKMRDEGLLSFDKNQFRLLQHHEEI